LVAVLNGIERAVEHGVPTAPVAVVEHPRRLPLGCTCRALVLWTRRNGPSARAEHGSFATNPAVESVPPSPTAASLPVWTNRSGKKDAREVSSFDEMEIFGRDAAG